MKKLMVTLIVVLTAIVSTSAQGYRRAGTSAEIKAMYKNELREKLQLSRSQAMNVDALQQDYMLKMRAIKTATTTTDEQKKDELAALLSDRNEKLKKLISEKQIAQLDEIYARPADNHKLYPPGEPTADKAKE